MGIPVWIEVLEAAVQVTRLHAPVVRALLGIGRHFIAEFTFCMLFLAHFWIDFIVHKIQGVIALELRVQVEQGTNYMSKLIDPNLFEQPFILTNNAYLSYLKSTLFR